MKDELRKKIGSKMFRIRKELGLKQAQMAAHFGIGRANYSRIEKGQIYPNEIVLHTLCTQFGISLNWLIADEGNMRAPNKDDEKDFTQCGRELEEMLYHIERLPMVKHAMLGFFLEYKFKNHELIQTLLEETEKKSETAR
jgi:transcriptional regulator with XRE-family HTH domain